MPVSILPNTSIRIGHSLINDTFSHIESVYMGIADYIPMTIFIIASASLSFIVSLSIQWDLTLIMMTTAPILILLRYFYSRVRRILLIYFFYSAKNFAVSFSKRTQKSKTLKYNDMHFETAEFANYESL